MYLVNTTKLLLLDFVKVPNKTVSAEDGKGKTTALKHLAVSWSAEELTELHKFQFVFHIALKRVKDNTPIETIIIGQHSGLEANKVKPEAIRAILDAKKYCKGKVLLLLDGYDEYKPGTNSDIDKFIEKRSLWNCCLILTSRETQEIGTLNNYMDAEFEITGFDGNSIEKYIKRSVGSEEKAEELLADAVDNELCSTDEQNTYDFRFSLLAIPMLLNIICNFFRNNVHLPKTKTEIIESLVNRVIDRENIRSRGSKALDTAKALVDLGKLVWQGLSTRKFTFSKVNHFILTKIKCSIWFIFFTQAFS